MSTTGLLIIALILHIVSANCALVLLKSKRATVYKNIYGEIYFLGSPFNFRIWRYFGLLKYIELEKLSLVEQFTYSMFPVTLILFFVAILNF